MHLIACNTLHGQEPRTRVFDCLKRDDLSKKSCSYFCVNLVEVCAARIKIIILDYQRSHSLVPAKSSKISADLKGGGCVRAAVEQRKKYYWRVNSRFNLLLGRPTPTKKERKGTLITIEFVRFRFYTGLTESRVSKSTNYFIGLILFVFRSSPDARSGWNGIVRKIDDSLPRSIHFMTLFFFFTTRYRALLREECER